MANTMAASGPTFIPGVQFRVAANWEKQTKGWIENIVPGFPDEGNIIDTNIVEGQLKFNFNENFEGWAKRAARLLGAVQAMQTRTGAPSPPSARADYQRTVADARLKLGAERFEATWAAGTAMTLDEAVDLALAAPRQADVPAEGRQPAIPLSPREREVVGLIAAGHSNRKIAERLVLSVRTVERHLSNTYVKLGVSGKAARAAAAARFPRASEPWSTERISR